jgi:acylphosphatase
MQAIRRVHVWISGDVHGVGFRWYAREQAMEHRVAGWVRNLRDGRVEAVFEGPAEAVEAILEWCRGGPRSAHVERVEVREEPPEDANGFRIDG